MLTKQADVAPKGLFGVALIQVCCPDDDLIAINESRTALTACAATAAVAADDLIEPMATYLSAECAHAFCSGFSASEVRMCVQGVVISCSIVTDSAQNFQLEANVNVCAYLITDHLLRLCSVVSW